MLPVLFVTVFIDLVGFGIIIPFLAYYVESFGARAAVVGLLMSSYSLAQFVFAPVWGRVSDRVGRRPILLLGLLGSVAGYTLFGLAGTLGLLFVGRVAPNKRVASLTADPTPAFSFGTTPMIASVAGAVMSPSPPPPRIIVAASTT